MALKHAQFSLKRLFLYTHIASIAMAAVVGIGQILTGTDRDFKVLLTAITIALASVCGLGCGAAIESKRARFIPIAGLVLTLIATLMILTILWTEPSSSDMEWFFKATVLTSTFAVGLSHISLLSVARLAPKFSWARPIATMSILAVAALINLPIFVNHVWNSDRLIRSIAVAAIIDAAMSVLIPIFHLLSRASFRSSEAAAPGSKEAIDHEISQLESRLAELRKLRLTCEDTGS